MNSKILELRSEQVTQTPPVKKHYYSYYFFIALILGFLGLFIYVNKDLFAETIEVETEKSIVIKSAFQDMQNFTTDKPLFQASGWIEPEPFIIKASAFVEGIVSEVRAIDGQVVRRGDILAIIDDRSLRLSIAEAELESKSLEKEMNSLDQKIKLAQNEAKLSKERYATAKVELQRIQRISEVMQKSGDGVPLIQRENAKFEAERQEKICRELLVEQELRENSIQILIAEKEILKQKIEVQKVSIANLHLNMERTVIRAPIEGIIQKMYARVGQKLMLSGDDMNSATVADIYDPNRLQLRVDIALADAEGLEVGMPANITTEILPNLKIQGLVTSIVGQADIAKNTIQAKVKILEPHPKLRPEMIARVEFMQIPKDLSNTESISSLRIYVPEKALLDRNSEKVFVWTVALEKGRERAKKKYVSLGANRKSNWQEIKDGILPGEILIVSNFNKLYDGCPVIQIQQKK